MPREQQELDPYAPPPRYKMKSGGMVRVAILAALLGLGAWGVMEFYDPNAPSLVAEEQTEQVAENRADGGYAVTPTPAPAAPATAAPQAAPAAPASEPVPPPSTTIGGEAGR
ncbi:hypothetical protein [Terricaulis silvestris]|uniref:Uncharacterized protein n=1 Tax=Terricaulis silvestris TaxID=2686094 RepID=A0A6I6MQ67_9CAUL|nr:hypothetical protein [Terricaulis silvestris]QGZ95536.1 hypothetical protein DSM104635_02385 [Terricaulis silvestris]